jgi:FtsZ-binding cell division protein ZapB
LTKTVEAIIAEDSGMSLRQRVAKLEVENSQLKAIVAQSAGTISMLQRAVDIGVEDYTMLMEGNKSLLAEHNDFHHHCEDLEIELVEVRSDAKKKVADLEVRVKSTEAHSVDAGATGEECLRDFEDGLV